MVYRQAGSSHWMMLNLVRLRCQPGEASSRRLGLVLEGQDPFAQPEVEGAC
jgi:hypothetical protein